ncbi:MAG TPA: DUF6130 family protein [Vineibacter sp.]|nr:DUF6130 family protein [Vineibacter sp.]
MKTLTQRLLATAGAVALLAAGPVLAPNAFAESHSVSQLVPIGNEPAPKLIVDAPAPGPLARGVAVIPYRLENFRILPVVGEDALKLSPRVGHLHVTLNDLPWHWADFGNTQSIVVAPLPPGEHKVLIELADPTHRVIASQTVTFTVPAL